MANKHLVFGGTAHERLWKFRRFEVARASCPCSEPRARCPCYPRQPARTTFFSSAAKNPTGRRRAGVWILHCVQNDKQEVHQQRSEESDGISAPLKTIRISCWILRSAQDDKPFNRTPIPRVGCHPVNQICSTAYVRFPLRSRMYFPKSKSAVVSERAISAVRTLFT
jgi:hypothetical protein